MSDELIARFSEAVLMAYMHGVKSEFAIELEGHAGITVTIVPNDYDESSPKTMVTETLEGE